VVKTPFTFFEVLEEFGTANAPELEHAKFGVAPKAFDTVDVIFTSGKLVFVMVNAVVFVTAGDQAIVSAPAIRIDVALFENLARDDRQQLLSGAVLDHTDQDVIAALVQTDNWNLAASSTPAFAPDTPSAKIGLVNLDLPGKRLGLGQSQLHQTMAKKAVKTMCCPIVELADLRGRKSRNIQGKKPQKLAKLPLRNLSPFYVSVFH
jgi:hypothetical protein